MPGEDVDKVEMDMWIVVFMRSWLHIFEDDLAQHNAAQSMWMEQGWEWEWEWQCEDGNHDSTKVKRRLTAENLHCEALLRY
jgi:hypothetical protein